jgi:hypothetical protein
VSLRSTRPRRLALNVSGISAQLALFFSAVLILALVFCHISTTPRRSPLPLLSCLQRAVIPNGCDREMLGIATTSPTSNRGQKLSSVCMIPPFCRVSCVACPTTADVTGNVIVPPYQGPPCRVSGGMHPTMLHVQACLLPRAGEPAGGVGEAVRICPKR